MGRRWRLWGRNSLSRATGHIDHGIIDHHRDRMMIGRQKVPRQRQKAQRASLIHRKSWFARKLRMGARIGVRLIDAIRRPAAPGQVGHGAHAKTHSATAIQKRRAPKNHTMIASDRHLSSGTGRIEPLRLLFDAQH